MLLWVLETIMITYVIFMGIVFVIFLVIKAKTIERDVIKIHHSIANANSKD